MEDTTTMTNRDLPAECHPDRKRFVGSLCTACYFRAKRAKKDTIALTSDFVARVTEIIDNRLKSLGVWDGVIEGDGEYARQLWAADPLKTTPKNETLPTELSIDITSLHTK